MSALSLPNSKERLLSWAKREVDGANVTEDHLQLVSLAVYLASRYDNGPKGGKKIGAAITRLALIALDSKDQKKIRSAKEWFEWLNHLLEDEDEVPLELSMLEVVNRKADEVKHATSPFSHNPSDLPKDWKGIDARVIDEGHGNTFKVGKGAQMTRSHGARINGALPKFDGPVLAAVHRTGGGGTFEIEGTFNDRAGIQFGGAEKETSGTTSFQGRKEPRPIQQHFDSDEDGESHPTEQDHSQITTPPSSSASMTFPNQTALPNSPNSISSFDMGSAPRDKKHWYSRRK